MAKVGRAIPAVHRHNHPPPNSINYHQNREGGGRRGRGRGEEIDESLEAAIRSSTLRRQMSRGGGASSSGGPGSKVPHIQIDSPTQSLREDSLYPSITTLASLQQEEEEDEFSCTDCCKSACSQFFNFTFASCMYVTCQRKDMHRRNSSSNVFDIEIEQMKSSLQFHFMNPFQKWRNARRRRFPWKLFVQLLNIVLVTLQLIFFASTKLPLTQFVESNHNTFVHLFIENPAAPTMYEPIPSPISVLYTIDELYSQLNFTTQRYHKLFYDALGPYGYRWVDRDGFNVINVLYMDVLEFNHSFIDPANKVALYSNDIQWNTYALSDNTTEWYWDRDRLISNLSSIQKIKIEFDLSSIYVSEHTPPKCFLFHIQMMIMNDIGKGNMPVYMTLTTEENACRNHTNAEPIGGSDTYNSIGLNILDFFVAIFATISTMLHLRSLVKSAYFAQIVRAFFLEKFNHKLKWKHLIPLFNLWFTGVILGNCLATVGAILRLIISLEPKTDTIPMVDIASIIVGLAVFAQWCGILRFLSYFDKYNMLLLTLRLSIPSVVRFFVCAGILYFAFLFCGWLVLGAYHPKFSNPSTTSENLFALLNGDDIYNTYQEMSKTSLPAYVFSKVYLYTFISLFIYVVLSVFISLISDTYETLHEHWNVRSKGLLEDFATGQLGRVCAARARAYSNNGDSTDEEDNKEYDRIREIAESSRFGSGSVRDGEKQPLLANGGPNTTNYTAAGHLNTPLISNMQRSAEFTIGDDSPTLQRSSRSKSHS